MFYWTVEIDVIVSLQKKVSMCVMLSSQRSEVLTAVPVDFLPVCAGVEISQPLWSRADWDVCTLVFLTLQSWTELPRSHWRGQGLAGDVRLGFAQEFGWEAHEYHGEGRN